MNKLLTIFAFACLLFSAQVKAQDDIPELILEETEGGYVIVNWEETRVEDEVPEETEESVTSVSNPSGSSSTSHPSSSTKKGGKTVRKSVKVTTRKSSHHLRGNN